MAHDHRETLDRTRGRVFDLEALLREMAEEEKAAIEASKGDVPDTLKPLENNGENGENVEVDGESDEDAQNEREMNLLDELLKKNEEDDEGNSL